MKQIVYQLFTAVFMFVVIASCDDLRVYEEYKTIPESEWHKDSLVVFNIPVTDTLQNHNLLIDVRNETNYGFSNLWLFIEIEQPNGKAEKDTFELTLADPSGKWLGEGLGNVKTRQVIYRRNVYFPVSGEYTVKIQQGMREDILERIHDIGFRIEKVGS